MLTYLFMICALASSPLIGQTDAQDMGVPPQKQVTESAPFQCTQPAAAQAAMIRKAEAHGYTLRRVEFIGNEHIRDRVLRVRLKHLQEGDQFGKGNLVRSVTNLSWLRIIHPVRMRDVVLHIDDENKLVDMLICVREKAATKQKSYR